MPVVIALLVGLAWAGAGLDTVKAAEARTPAPLAINVPDLDALHRALEPLSAADGSPPVLVAADDAVHAVLTGGLAADDAVHAVLTGGVTADDTVHAALDGGVPADAPALRPAPAPTLAEARTAAPEGCVVWVRPAEAGWTLVPAGCLTTRVPPPAPPAPVVTAAAPAPPPVIELVARPAFQGGWGVEAGGRRLDTVTLARRLGDDATADRLLLERRRTLRYAVPVGIGGALLAIGGLSVQATAPDAQSVPERPDPARFEDFGAYGKAEARWRERQIAADARDERVWTSAALLTGAGLCFVLVPIVGGEARARAAHPGLVYTEAEIRAKLAVGPGTVGVVAELP